MHMGPEVKCVHVWPVSGAEVSTTYRAAVGLLSGIGVLFAILPDYIDKLFWELSHLPSPTSQATLNKIFKQHQH